MVKRATLRDKWVRGPRPLPGKQVWAHSTHQGQADYQDGQVPVYDSSYPLLLRSGAWNTAPLGDRMQEAVDAGMDGLQVLIYGWEQGDRYVSELMPEAEKVGLKIAPCYMNDDASGLAGQIAQWIATAGTSTAAGRDDDGKLLVWIYAAKDTDVPAVMADSRVAGKVAIIGDLGTGASQTGLTVSSASLDTHGTRYRAAWNFEDSMHLGSPATVFDQVIDWCRRRMVPFAGGVMPGYNRENPPTGGYIDPRGTRLLREQWERHLSLSWTRWVTIVTWQDYSEGHTIRPSSDWHFTRSDVCRWYSDELKGKPHPNTPQLYITAPTHIHQGEQVKAEALVLNGSASSVGITVELLNPSGAVVSSATGTAAAGKIGDAVTSDNLTGLPWVRPRATMVAGGVTTTVLGAPVLIYAAGFQPTTPDRRRYNSVAARRSTGVGVSLTKSGATATVSATTTPRTIEVLQNTRSAGRGYGVKTKTVTVPMASYSGVGQGYNAASTGWLIGRAISTDGSVTYTDPIAL